MTQPGSACQGARNVGTLEYFRPLVANLKQAIAFHLNQYDKVIARLGNLINHHQMELAQARQKAQDSVLRLKELNSKIPEAQQTLEKLQKTVKMLTTTDDRHNRSGDFFAHGRSDGGLNAGMGRFMGGQNGGGGGNFGGQNGGAGGNFGGQNGGAGGNFGGQNGGVERFMKQNRGMGGLMAGQNEGFGNLMGVSMAGQSGRMPNNMAVQGNSGGRGSNSGQRPTNPSLF